MILSLIVAASENNVIGRDNDLPWSLPDDLKYFRKMTEGATLITGRKNHEAIGRVLPGRRTIVITRQDKEYEGCVTVHSLSDALHTAEHDEKIFVMGGGEVYAQALPLADRLYLTRVHAEIDGDVYFPDIDEDEWEEVSREAHEADDKHAYPFTWIEYKKR